MNLNRTTVADMRVTMTRGQKLSMLCVTNGEEPAAAALQKKVELRKDTLAQWQHIPKRKNPNLRR